MVTHIICVYILTGCICICQCAYIHKFVYICKYPKYFNHKYTYTPVHTHVNNMSNTNKDTNTTHTLDKSKFVKEQQVWSVCIDAKHCQKILKDDFLKEHIVDGHNVKRVINNEKNKDKKNILLKPTVAEETIEALKEKGFELQKVTLKTTYENTSAYDILRSILPDDVSVPSSYEVVGHIAHFNMREEQLPYKHIIASVTLDKNTSIRTVVNKVCDVHNEFRTLNMELLAGDDDYIAEVAESGIKLRVDYANVYWNSRLCTERSRLLDIVPSGSIVCDVMAGVGGFAVCAAKFKNCHVYANDLNPIATKYLNINANKNQVSENMHCFNLDGRRFIHTCVKHLNLLQKKNETKSTQIHFIMNLPAIALEFTDAFKGLKTVSETFHKKKITHVRDVYVHCYYFSPPETFKQVAETHISQRLGFIPSDAVYKQVRDVAPQKKMFVVMFKLPTHILEDTPIKVGGEDTHTDDAQPKKREREDDDDHLHPSPNKKRS